MDKRAFTEKEASEYLAISRSALRQARMDGHRESRMQSPPFVKLGKSVRYLREDLDAWLDAHKVSVSPGNFRHKRR